MSTAEKEALWEMVDSLSDIMTDVLDFTEDIWHEYPDEVYPGNPEV